MIRHSNSFIVSIFIHLILLALVYLSYRTLTASQIQEKKEPLLCIKLSSYQAQKSLITPPVKKTPKKSKSVPVKASKKIVKVVVKKKEEVIKEAKAIKKVKIEKKTEVKTSVVIPEITQAIVKPIKKEVVPEEEYIDANIAKIIALLKENLYYPRRARKRGIEGKVLVRFTLSVKAEISNIKILSSTSEVLSRGALQTISNIDHKLPVPKQSITFNIPISYKLY